MNRNQSGWLGSSCLLLVLLAAGPGTAQVEIRDSAGIRIVRSTGPLWAAASGWWVSDTPILDIVAERSPGEEHTSPRGAMRLGDGGIVILARDGLRIYSATGKIAASVGDLGSSGGFRSPTWIGSPDGNRIMVWDQRLKRLLGFNSLGHLIRSPEPVDLHGWFPEVVGVFGDGSFVVTPGADPTAVPGGGNGVRQDTLRYSRYAPDGARPNGLGVFPGDENYLLRRRSGFAWHALPFGRKTFLAVQGDRIHVGYSGSYQIASYTPAGRLVRIIRKPHHPIGVTAEDVESAKRQHLSRIKSTTRRLEMQRVFAEAPLPSTMPAFAGLYADASGNLWVEEYRRPSDQQPRWIVFAPDGRMLGVVRTPPGLRILQIGSDFVLGIREGSSGVYHVQVYRLSKTGR